MTAHVTGVRSATYRLPMPVPWGPIADCQYLIATTVTASDGSTGQGFSWAVQAGAQAIQAMIDADSGPAATGGSCASRAAASPRSRWRRSTSACGTCRRRRPGWP
jgi:hypothetical protein